MFATSWVGDKYHIRGPIIIVNMIICLIGIPIMGFHSSANVRYFGVFLTTAGANSNIPATMSYQANNIRGQWKRAFCSATLVGFGGLGGIAGSLIFRTQDAPQYRPGLYACIACCLLNIIIVSVTSLKFLRENRRADRGEGQIEGAGVSDQFYDEHDYRSLTLSSRMMVSLISGIHIKFSYQGVRLRAIRLFDHFGNGPDIDLL